MAFIFYHNSKQKICFSPNFHGHLLCMHHINASSGCVVFVLVTGDKKDVAINLTLVLNICAVHVPPPLCPTAPPRAGNPAVPSGAWQWEQLGFDSPPTSQGSKTQFCLCLGLFLSHRHYEGGGNCSLAKGHPVSWDPGPPYWKNEGEFQSQQMKLCVGKRGKKKLIFKPESLFSFPKRPKGLCFSLWFSLYVGLALGSYKNPECLKAIETPGSPCSVGIFSVSQISQLMFITDFSLSCTQNSPHPICKCVSA